MGSLLDQVAILHQFADERIDLAQTQRSLRAALQAASHEAVLGHAQLQGQGAGLVGGRAAILLDQREHALNAARSKLGLSLVDGIAESADAGSSLVSPRQQLLDVKWGTPRTVLIADAVRAALLPQMLAQQLSGPRIEQAHEQPVPLHQHLAPDPSRRRSVVGRLHLDTAVQVNGAIAVLVVAERLQRQRLASKGFSSANIAATCRLVVPWMRVSAQRSSQ